MRKETRAGVLSTLWAIIGKDSYEEIEDIPELDADKVAKDVMNRINHKQITKNNADVGGTQTIDQKVSEKTKNVERERE